ncbi:MAG: SDR family oxidoreductase [Paludibacter sp.]|jgi:NAD(P)-dependent dehydrogenase (short-subunit alcohol dehydrogenase family)|nr:SDR family oxidoreductase [Paludibacter sp.]
MSNPFSLENKTILVTGASSGIGRATAIECAKMGATVIITGRNAPRLNETFLQLVGENHLQFTADLTVEKDRDFLIENLLKLDGVVHCAGITKTLMFQFVDEQSLVEVMNVNFVAPTLVSARLVEEKKLKKGSSIVFISSISGTVCVMGGNSCYSASKGAVNGVMKNMALDLAAKGIRVNSVNPGMIDTHIFDGGLIGTEQLAEDAKRYPLKRYGKPEEVAYAAVYLLSDAAEWVTGTSLLIDGGYTLQ